MDATPDASSSISESGEPASRSNALSPGISLVIPAYNEAPVIAQAVREAVAALAGLTDDFEVLVVDDGSTDQTAAIVEASMTEHPQVRLLRQPRNLGYGAALRRGFSEASRELVGFTDADCQFDLTELDRLVMLARDYDIVTGYRIDRQDAWLRKVYSAGYNVLVRNLLGTRVRDCDCALKIFHRAVLAELPITTDGFLINGEMLARARQLEFSIVEVGVSHRARAGGESKVSVTHIPVVLAALIRHWWNAVMFPGVHLETRATARIWPRRTQVMMTLLLAVVGAVLLLANLKYALIEPDEARYAQIALEMVDSGDWVTPRLNGEPYLDKPPLLYWMTATSFQWFGLNERSARLPCAVAGWMTVLVTYLLGRRLVEDRAACLGAMLLVLSGGFVLAGRFLIMDSVLTLFTTLGLLSACCALRAAHRAWVWWLVTGVACGLGILTKGPVAPVICIPPIVVVAWLTRNRGPFRMWNLLAVALPALAIAAPWFLQIAEAQSQFVGHFFWKHHIERFVHAFNHAQPWWFYAPVLALGMLPGTLLAPALVVYLGQKTARACQRRTQELGALLAGGLWIVGFFSLSSCKLPTYILPAFPLFALALGNVLSDAVAEPSTWADRSAQLIQQYTRRALRQAMSLSAVAAGGALVAWVILVPDRWWLALVLAIAVALLAARSRHMGSFGMLRLATAGAAACMVVMFFGYGYVVPEFANWRSISLSAERVNKQLGSSAPIVFFGRPSQAARLAIEGDIAEFSVVETADFEQLLHEHEAAVVVATGTDLEVLKDRVGPLAEFRGPEARRRVYVATRIKSLAEAGDDNSNR